jgi:hypothetical protein
MTWLSGKDILDAAAAAISDSSAGTRVKMLSWLNTLVVKLASDRIGWRVLEVTSLNMPISNNQLTPASDFQSLVYLKQGTTYFFEQEDELTDAQMFQILSVSPTGTTPQGFKYSPATGLVTFYPGSTGNWDIRYIKEHPVVVDNTSLMLFTKPFLPVLMRGCLDFFYEYDMDPRAGSSYQLDSILLSELYAWELSNRPLPRLEPQGYMRRRL